MITAFTGDPSSIGRGNFFLLKEPNKLDIIPLTCFFFFSEKLIAPVNSQKKNTFEMIFYFLGSHFLKLRLRF